MTQDEIIRMAQEADIEVAHMNKPMTDAEVKQAWIQRFAALVAAHERETYRLPKMTEEQIWKCNHDSDGGYHICVEHQNVVDFARAIEREIGFDRANMWLKRIKDAIAAEREVCAKLMDDMAARDNMTNYYKVAANAIRARINQ